MATGRIGVTPTLGTRWSKAPAGGTTSLSGLDDNSVSLVYSVGYEQVYRNGVLLSRGNDYTATTGNSITLIDATIAGDIIEVFANELVPLTDAISKGQFTAKGALLSATAASTPGVLTVGSNNQVLTADSSTSTGLKWATPAAGSLTSLATGSLSGSSVTISSISGSYKSLQLRIVNAYSTGGVAIGIQFNSDTTSGNYNYALMTSNSTVLSGASSSTLIDIANTGLATANRTQFIVNIDGYTNNAYKNVTFNSNITNVAYFGLGVWKSTAAITAITILFDGSDTFSSGGTYELFGVN